ncbi:aldehyde dehydrogenase family protein [Sphingobium sp. Cam5-1]|uniref:aldehyde dehydrogenase family protein n=1 Tax=Sphingobium sp. Cam5-1 TaxID=2789327 RepID=UPI0018AD23BC|nr:aldehyde dehydrogenase family protein [Sphingobium sp. Cam5-1]QPI74633.1 aldehyde dehydrogenase family protein [Sphingobium sp. Cam5-1]
MALQYRNLIGGEWVSGNPSPNINPSDTNDVIGEYHQGEPADAAAAIAAARAAFPAWSRGPIQQRADILDRVGSEILQRTEEIADLLSREEGKTLREARGEVTRAGQIFRFFAGEVVRQCGDKHDSIRPGVEIDITREPVGVVSLITPWNFPIAIPAWKIAPALAYGNTVVFKPADLTPGCAWLLAEILHRAGIPSGAFNLVMGRGSRLGSVLAGPGVDAVSFTGSDGVGRNILAAGAEHGFKVQLEMGGKNPLVVMADAELDVAVECALDGAFFATGQRCTASSRLIVEDAIHDRFVEALSRRIGEQVVGDARAADTTIGPVVDERQLRSNLDHLARAHEDGATLVTGGERVERRTPGFFQSPALFVDTRSGMRINQDEVFGPVASVIRVADYDEAVTVANDVRFGLVAGICTTSLRHASRFRRDAQAGMVMVNLPTAGVDYHVPFGGRKASSHGPREQGSYAAEFYTTVKTAYVRA